MSNPSTGLHDGHRTAPAAPAAHASAAAPTAAPLSLCDRRPGISADGLVAGLLPPPRFAAARFATYVPDPAHPSQAEAVRELTAFAARAGGRVPRLRRRLFGRRTDAPAASSGSGTFSGSSACTGSRASSASAEPSAPSTPSASSAPPAPRGIYLDGGYGVGKTHLLAALWHATKVPPEQKAFCTFVELTHLVGALGFQGTVRALGAHRLLCIDEFELDDPGDTVLVSSLLGRLADAGVALAATSNTLPDRLGEGRFAADDFLREIQGLARSFRTVRIDGDDYRHRGLPRAPDMLRAAAVTRAAAAVPGASLDAFPQLLDHLAELHPSRYGALTDSVRAVCLTGVRPVHDQAAALRLVVLADRLHDRAIPVVASGTDLGGLFGAELLAGGYRKKYRRALSRLTALAREGRQLVRETAAQAGPVEGSPVEESREPGGEEPGGEERGR